MINFQLPITFSDKLSNKRIQEANKLFGSKAVNRIIGLALFLLGGNRDQISNIVGLPKGTFYSFLTRFYNHGIDAFFDKRENISKKTESPAAGKVAPEPSVQLELIFGHQNVLIFPSGELKISPGNNLQFKIIVLSFMNSDFITPKKASELLEISERHVRQLGKKIQSSDIVSLTDQRKGQRKDYIFTKKIKAELIQQFTVNSVAGTSTSSRTIARQVNEACNVSVSDRGVRQHVSKLGLNTINVSLPTLLCESKKK